MNRTLIGLAALALTVTLTSSPASAAQCRDGSFSTSSGPGTCSWHGGIDDGTPSWGGGGGSGGGSGTSGIYYSSSSYRDEEETSPEVLVFAAGAIWFWVWFYRKFSWP